jgi:hypothetical protein
LFVNLPSDGVPLREMVAVRDRGDCRRENHEEDQQRMSPHRRLVHDRAE